jgi:UDP-N-acetyl-D-glucosamine dehydrogenase
MTYGEFKNTIKSKRLTVAVVGLGYVGMPTSLAIARVGIKVIGVDINRARVRQINNGKSFIAEISDDEIKSVQKYFKATSDWKELKRAQVIIIAVPTPLTKYKTPDVSFIETATKNIARNFKSGTLIILESTTYPGTTEEIVKPILSARGRSTSGGEKSRSTRSGQAGLVAGKDFYLAFAPERIDPGNKQYKFTDIPKVVGGIDSRSTELASTFYETFLKSVHKVSSTRAAEMTKLLENIFRLVNISLVNELKMVGDKMDIDFWEVVEAAKTKPYGFMPFYPGPGVGGHCIPLDPFYLSWKARELNFFTRFIDLAGEINELMPHHVVTKVIWALNKHKKSVRGSKILVVGAAYKKDVDDPRESAAIPVIWDLMRKGADISYHDPYISELRVNGTVLHSKLLDKNLLKNTDCVVIITDHTKLDYKMIEKEAKLIIDTRNAIKKKAPHIIN